MKKLLYKMMEYKFIYRLMPKWMKFIYSFDIMAKNKSGSLHLDNGYSLNFETMRIEKEDADLEWEWYWIAFKNGEYISGTDTFGNPIHTKNKKEAFRFYNFEEAFVYFEYGYAILRE